AIGVTRTAGYSIKMGAALRAAPITVSWIKFFPELYQMPGDPAGESPDGVSLPGIDGDVLPARLPGVVPGDPDELIGKALPRLRNQLVLILQGLRLQQMGQGDGKNLLHLRRAGP